MEQPMNVMQSWSNYCVYIVWEDEDRNTPVSVEIGNTMNTVPANVTIFEDDLDLETAVEMANQLRAKYDIPVPE
jgi:hypothetical protein